MRGHEQKHPPLIKISNDVLPASQPRKPTAHYPRLQRLSDTKTEQEKTTMALIWVQYLAQHHTNTSTIWTPNPSRSHRSQAATAQHHEIVPGDVTRAPARGYNR